MEFVISFDMRAPEFGTPAQDLYDAALDQCAWADSIGFDAIGLGEHHASDDGYLPSPIPFAGAIASRTQRIIIRPNVLLAPLYEPVKLAEDLAVLQFLANGRLEVVIGAGYRPYEFGMFGKRREDRKELYMRAFEVLRKAWTGQPFVHEGRDVTVTPVPNPPPRLLLGGSHPAVAKRAARIADGYYPPGGENWDLYRAECLALGKPDPGEQFKALGPIYTHISNTPDADWEQIAPHAAHVVRSYSEWTVEAYGRAAGPFAGGVDTDDLRRSGAYQVLRPEEAVEQIQALGRHRTFILTPLLGGLDPDLAWQGLRLFEDEVWPHVRDLRDAPEAWGDASSFRSSSPKEVVRRYYQGLNDRSVDAVYSLYAEDARFEVVSDGPFGGEQPKSREVLEQLFQTFSRLDFEIESLISDGHRVSAEVTARGSWADGRPYGNRYHNVFEFRDGRIAYFREYPSNVAPA